MLLLKNNEYHKRKPKKGKKKENEYHISYVNVCKRLHTSTKVEVRESHELWLDV